MAGISRRDFVKLLGAGGAMSALGLTGCETVPKTSAKAAPRVVVIGGGFGGATCAKYLRVYDPTLNVTMIEQNASFTTCPGSNWVLGGLRKMDDLTQNYDALRSKHGVKVVTDRAGFALYFSRAPIPHARDFQDSLPQRWTELATAKHIGLYVYRREFLLSYPRLTPTPLEQQECLEQLRALEHGFRIRVAETTLVGQGVDTPEDLEKVRRLLAGSQ